MDTLSLQPATTVVLVLASAYAMLGAGVMKRRLVWRSRRCSVCRRPRGSCVCNWR